MTCPAGKSVISGGGLVTDGVNYFNVYPVALTESSNVAGSSDTTWRVQAKEVSAYSGSWELRVYARCAFVQ